MEHQKLWIRWRRISESMATGEGESMATGEGKSMATGDGAGKPVDPDPVLPTVNDN
jgi:hypothetical protein